MSNPDILTAQILVADDVPNGHDQALVDGLASLGVAASSRVVARRRGINEAQWMILVALPLQAFLTALVGKLAEDAYKALKSLVDRAFGKPAATSERPKVLMLQDPSTRLQIVLENDLPDEAYQRLLQLDLTTIQGGLLGYDLRLSSWRLEADTADSR